jgi:hypothetical protein
MEVRYLDEGHAAGEVVVTLSGAIHVRGQLKRASADCHCCP